MKWTLSSENIRTRKKCRLREKTDEIYSHSRISFNFVSIGFYEIFNTTVDNRNWVENLLCEKYVYNKK